MKLDTVQIAAEVVAKAGRELPADQALRQTLKAHNRIAPWDAAEISALVFNYYRWLGWLTNETHITARLRRARELAAQFERKPESIPSADLRSRAVPAWVKDEVEITDAWLRTLQCKPALWLRTPRGEGRALARRFKPSRPAGEGWLSDTIEYPGEEDLFRTPEFHGGKFEVQDISSQAVGWICDPKSGETWWDACAGEGGKLLHLSDLMSNKGLIWASDRAEWRLKNLKRRAARAKAFNYRAELWDGGAKLPTKTKFDGILIDAPCSGLGTWQRNPHARWTTAAQDVKELSEVQLRLLSHAATALKPGGKLVYSVCTVTRSETDSVADAFESWFDDIAPLSVRNPLAPDADANPRIWLWPQESRGNGMFIAIWQKTANAQ